MVGLRIRQTDRIRNKKITFFMNPSSYWFFSILDCTESKGMVSVLFHPHLSLPPEGK
jgi:hypothetical protein